MSVQVLQQPQLLTPLVTFDPIPIEHLNCCLLAWGHKMGALRRPYQHLDRAYGLFHDGRCVGVVSTSPLVS